MNKSPITEEGAKKLRDELHLLKGKDRQRIIKAISEARAHGDLKENAEYHAAKEEQGLSEARIRDIESKLSNAQIIDIKNITPSDKVIFGSTIELFDVDNEIKISYKIVGEDESDISAGLLSFSAPLARAIIGKREGDEVEVNPPGGTKTYEITKVLYI
ncbi:MAG: transcription elongation factor GreA [Pseudomonadota bacterium]|nr:transcription elongation factor GreA [Pseudomonadota bacterium]